MKTGEKCAIFFYESTGAMYIVLHVYHHDYIFSYSSRCDNSSVDTLTVYIVVKVLLRVFYVMILVH